MNKLCLIKKKKAVFKIRIYLHYIGRISVDVYSMYMCVCVCMWRERERETERFLPFANCQYDFPP